ncbi:protein tincar-like [Anneissia japonica]|uniref:protein tincar-like n=1 Tax=Anneissia japonica TaxID=1529436 RepID=UPI0014257436|nr:protein tincar-like [Anneissia japonica]XP_033102936.1 protein tincar-like [Anneissia japonica]
MTVKKGSMKLNSLQSIWYCVFVIVTHTYLIISAFYHYHRVRHMDWPQGMIPYPELGLYMLCVVAALLITILFIPTQIFQVGNNANDRTKLGMEKGDKGPPKWGGSIKAKLVFVRRYTKHLGPVGATMHIVSAFCLLLPVMFLQAREIEHGLLPPESIWRSEVSLVPVIELDKTPVPPLETDLLSTSEPDLKPHHKEPPYKISMVTINYINYVTALVVYAILYGDVFWFCHKGFALLLSVQLMFNAIQYSLGFIGVSLLYKLHTYGWEKYGIPEPAVVNSAAGLVGLFLTNNITIFLSAVVTFLYGYTRMKESELRKRQKNVQKGKPLIMYSGNALRCQGYIPHIGALCVLVIFIVCKSPLIVEYLRAFRHVGDPRLLACMLYDIFYIFFWAVLWVVFALKRKWDFNFAYLDSDRDDSESTTQSVGSIGSVTTDSPVSRDDIELTLVNNRNGDVHQRHVKEEPEKRNSSKIHLSNNFPAFIAHMPEKFSPKRLHNGTASIEECQPLHTITPNNVGKINPVLQANENPANSRPASVSSTTSSTYSGHQHITCEC